MSVLKRAAYALTCLWLGLAAGTAQAIAESAAEQIAPAGEAWTPHKAFDFGMANLGFEASVPAGASVETTRMEPREPGTFGRIMIVGKIYPGESGLPGEVTIQAFDLTTPAAASRICPHEAEIDGFTVRRSRSAADLSEAELFATKADGDRPIGGIFSRCMTRGKQMLAIHFLFDVSDVKDEAALDQRTERAYEYYKTFMSSLVFADGQSSGYGDSLLEIPVRIGKDESVFAVPDVWQVPINDFSGPLPAELHLLRENDSGEPTNLLWLNVQERPEAPDLEKLGPVLIGDYFVQQSADAERPVLLASAEDPDLSKAGIASRSFRFSVRNKNGDDIGDILAALFWKDGRLYVLSLWSRWSPAADRNTFFSRLPGLTTFDLIDARLLAEATANR